MTPRRVCWDACAWIAAIIQETAPIKRGGTEDRGAMCNAVLRAAAQQRIEIATSGLSMVEVCKNTHVLGDDDDLLTDFFHNDFILVVPLDKHVGTIARRLMMAGHAGLRPPDASHLATAIVCEAAELHTFDSALLRLDAQLDRLDGGKLKICKPRAQLPHAPLLEKLEAGS